MTTQSDRYQDDIMLPQLGCDWHQAGHKLDCVCDINMGLITAPCWQYDAGA